MLTKRIVTPFITGLLLVGLSACGSDEESSSDATEAEASSDATEAEASSDTDAAAEPDATEAAGSADGEGTPFCAAAQAAETAGDAVAIDSATPAELAVAIPAAVEASKAAQALAPDEIKDAVDQVVSFQDQLAAALEAADWDFAVAAQSQAFADIASNVDVETASSALDAYLAEHCGMSAD